MKIEAPYVHRVDSNGNLEWVERIIEAMRHQPGSPFYRRGKWHLTDDEFRRVMRLAFRNGANEQHSLTKALVGELGKLVPPEKP